MTTIAYRDGVLASDSRATQGDLICGSARKIFGLPDGSAVAFTGEPAHSSKLLAALLAGKTQDLPDVQENGRIIHFRHGEPALLYEQGGSLELAGPFFAFGSGMGAALGAMHMGASAERAVEIACQCDHYSGLPMVSVRVTARVVEMEKAA